MGLISRPGKPSLYWARSGIKIKRWVYRVYKLAEDNILIEFDTFRSKDDPYEDIEEGSYILNTNYGNDPADDKDMIDKQKAVAYLDPWKRNIEKLKKSDRVFLYRSGQGIVALRTASGKLEKKLNGEVICVVSPEELCQELKPFFV